MRYKIIIVLAILSLALTTYAQAPEIALKDKTIQEQIEFWSLEYGTDPNLIKLMILNEGWTTKKNCGDNGLSCGIAQYQKETFNRHSRLKGETLNYKSNFDQLKLMTWAVANGYGREWTSYRCIKNGGSYTFWYRLQNKYITIYCTI